MSGYRTACKVDIPDLDLSAPSALATLRELIERRSAEQGHPCPIPDECASFTLWTLQERDPAARR